MYSHVLRCIAMYAHVLPCIIMYCQVVPCIPMYCHVLPCVSMYCHVFILTSLALKYYHMGLITIEGIQLIARTLKNALPISTFIFVEMFRSTKFQNGHLERQFQTPKKLIKEKENSCNAVNSCFLHVVCIVLG